MRSKRGQKTEALRARIEAEADPVGFMIQVSKGKGFAWGDGTFFPTPKMALDANLWLGDRTLPKLKEVQVDHGVSGTLAERVRAAENKVDREAISVNKGVGAVEGGRPVTTSNSTPLPKMRDQNFEGDPDEKLRAGVRRLTTPPAHQKDFADAPGPAYVPIDAELLPPGEKSTAEKTREEYEALLTSGETITTSMELASSDDDLFDDILGGL